MAMRPVFAFVPLLLAQPLDSSSAPAMPSATSSGVRPCLSAASTSAPRATRSAATSIDPPGSCMVQRCATLYVGHVDELRVLLEDPRTQCMLPGPGGEVDELPGGHREAAPADPQCQSHPGDILYAGEIAGGAGIDEACGSLLISSHCSDQLRTITGAVMTCRARTRAYAAANTQEKSLTQWPDFGPQAPNSRSSIETIDGRTLSMCLGKRSF